MPDFNSRSRTSRYPLDVLEQNPLLSDQLLMDCNYDPHEVSAIMEPLLNAPTRCQQTGFYIQAITTGYTAFLSTNLIEKEVTEATPTLSSWLVGRSTVCAISIQHDTVSRRHAVIGHCPSGFYIADLGSLNGTWVNRRRLIPAQRTPLQDGDLIRFGVFGVEFFLSKRDNPIPAYLDETAY